jgi:hypothetical protein
LNFSGLPLFIVINGTGTEHGDLPHLRRITPLGTSATPDIYLGLNIPPIKASLFHGRAGKHEINSDADQQRSLYQARHGAIRK